MIRRRVTMTTETTASGAVGLGRGGRLSRQRKRDAVLRLLRGEDLETLSRALGATAATLTGWQDTFVAAGEASLATRSTAGEALETERLKAKLGEMLLERELLDAKIVALEANGRVAKFWRLRLVEPAGGICTSEPEGPHDPERDCRKAEAPVEGRLQGPALRGGADPTGRLVVPALPAQLSRHRRAVSVARLGGRPLHPEPLGAGLRAPDREETAGLPQAPLRLNPGRRNVHQDPRPVAVFVPGHRQARHAGRLPAHGQARPGGRQALLSQGAARPAAALPRPDRHRWGGFLPTRHHGSPEGRAPGAHAGPLRHQAPAAGDRE